MCVSSYSNGQDFHWITDTQLVFRLPSTKKERRLIVIGGERQGRSLNARGKKPVIWWIIHETQRRELGRYCKDIRNGSNLFEVGTKAIWIMQQNMCSVSNKAKARSLFLRVTAFPDQSMKQALHVVWQRRTSPLTPKWSPRFTRRAKSHMNIAVQNEIIKAFLRFVLGTRERAVYVFGTILQSWKHQRAWWQKEQVECFSTHSKTAQNGIPW